MWDITISLYLLQWIKITFLYKYDDTDINHEQAKKMKNLCLVRDASSKQEKYVNGYKVCEYAALSKNMKSAISLYSKVYSIESTGFVSENNETILNINWFWGFDMI